MKLSDINPHIRYAGIHKAAFRLKSSICVCYDCRLFFFDHTPGSILINGSAYKILNKTVIFLPPETEYQINIQFQKNSKVVILDFDLTNDHADLRASLGTATKTGFDKTIMPDYTLPPELPGPVVRVVPQLEHTLTQCANNFLLQNSFYRENSSALLKLSLLELIRQNTSSNQSVICEEVLSYIHEHYAESTLTNKNIAERFNYHPDHLSSIVRAETGKSLHQYLIYYRLRVAKNYLITTRYDIADIAWRCGFCSSAYFIKTFRENTGMTPGTYRRLKIHTEL